jgi:hypothetical protein
MRMPAKCGVAVIGDLVRSRRQEDRKTAQKQFVEALDRVNESVLAVQPFAPTVGDECQALYHELESAVRATLLLRLYLPDSLDCRFGIGAGEYATIGEGQVGGIQDGSAWWSARDAIVETKRRERRNATLRTWYAIAPDVRRSDFPSAAMTNAYLLCRDQLVSDMSNRNRRRLLGLIEGQSQVELAAAEGITQSAVSQSLRTSGAFAILDGSTILGTGARQ